MDENGGIMSKSPHFGKWSSEEDPGSALDRGGKKTYPSPQKADILRRRNERITAAKKRKELKIKEQKHQRDQAAPENKYCIVCGVCFERQAETFLVWVKKFRCDKCLVEGKNTEGSNKFCVRCGVVFLKPPLTGLKAEKSWASVKKCEKCRSSLNF